MRSRRPVFVTVFALSCSIPCLEATPAVAGPQRLHPDPAVVHEAAATPADAHAVARLDLALAQGRLVPERPAGS